LNLSFTPFSYLIIVVFSISILVLYFSFKNILASREVFIIASLRAFILLLLFILIWNPKLKYKASEENSLPWHVYVDNSLSIKYHKQPSSISYKNGIKSFLNKIKKKGVIVETFSFGSVLDTLEDISNLKLNANSTNLGLVFDKINNDYQKNVAGAIIFTDGQINQGLPIQHFYLNDVMVPIHIIGIGEITPMQDVSIKSVDIPPLCVKGQDVNIDVVISSLGSIDDRVNITLFDNNNKLIGSKIISVSGNQENEVVRFQISPNKIGENKFLVKCSALPDEINIQNNQQKITLQVMKDQYNVALVTGAPNYNTKVLKSYFKKKGNTLVDHYLVNSKNFNQEIKSFLEKKYEVIIFDNNPVSSSGEKWDSITRVFAKKLLSHNSSFFIVPGPETEIKSINRYLKIIDLDANQLSNSPPANKKWEFSSEWNNLSSINKEYQLPSDSYPPQTPIFRLINNFENQEIGIYAKYIDSEKTNPLLVLGEKQSVRYAIWNSINLSSLKYMLVDSDLDFLFENSLKKITNWLMKKNDNSEFIFRTDKNTYQHGESISLTGVPLDFSDLLKINDGIVELYHNSKYIGSKPLFFDLNDNIYKANFWAPKPGKIDYIVKINKNLENYEVSRGAFKVQESHVELNRIFLNEAKLKNLSTPSDGTFKRWVDNEDLINTIEDIQKSKSYIAIIAFRYNYIYICFIILLLSVEWFYRKKIGFS
tara:strand:- start:103 stop:2226 length:2124 start_codon:yes stop_codon:yes gene_type:complete